MNDLLGSLFAVAVVIAFFDGDGRFVILVALAWIGLTGIAGLRALGRRWGR